MNELGEVAQKGCVVIPAFREAERVGGVVRAARAHVPRVLVVDDGSPDETAEAAAAAGAEVIRHPTNRGKGAALQTGFQWAREKGFEFVITMDADGQHDPADLPRFLEAYGRARAPVLIGNRMDDVRTMPLPRRWTNRFLSGLLSREMGQCVPDTQCGYRLYRCDVLPPEGTMSCRYDSESEILLQLAENGVPLASVPVRTIYRDERSKIHPAKDTVRFIRMLRKYRREKRRRTVERAATEPGWNGRGLTR